MGTAVVIYDQASEDSCTDANPLDYTNPTHLARVGKRGPNMVVIDGNTFVNLGETAIFHKGQANTHFTNNIIVNEMGYVKKVGGYSPMYEGYTGHVKRKLDAGDFV